jgi:glycosyltransferase involved in cell wall biosynthesis
MLDPWSLSQSRLKKRVYMLWRLRRNLNTATALHFTSSVERDLTAPLRLRPPAIVEPNGLDLSEFETLPPAGTARRRFGVTTSRMVLFLSRLHPKKGLELLIPAFAKAKLDDTTLVLAGPDADGYQAKLEDIVARQGLPAEAVLFAGMQRGVERLSAMADADLFVLPSYQENFGIAVAEALAAGCPVLISDQVNIWQEIKAAGVGGVVAPAVEPLTGALREWMDDSARRTEAATRAKLFARDRYDWRALARRWAEHYHGLARTAARSAMPATVS